MRQPGHKPGRRKEKREMGECLRFDCVWHGTMLYEDAPFCEYAVLHSIYDIPGDTPCRLCEPGERCTKFRAGNSFKIAENFTNGSTRTPVIRTIVRAKPSPKKVEKFLKNLEALRKQREAAEKKRLEAMKNVTDEQIKELYNKGFSDVAIARTLRCEKDTVTRWRELNGLDMGVRSERAEVDLKKILFYYEHGLSDRDIATLCKCSVPTVAKYRARLKLPCNYQQNRPKKAKD